MAPKLVWQNLCNERPNKNFLRLDLMYEILIRTDMNYLPILKRVCKQWHNIIYHPQFLCNHYQRDKIIGGHIFRPDPEKAPAGEFIFVPHLCPWTAMPNLDFLPQPVKIEASTTDGILYCAGFHGPFKHFVCKPTTREWIEIPKPSKTGAKIKIFLAVTYNGDNVLRFKILRIPKTKSIMDAEIFDSETWKWTYKYFFDVGEYESVALGLMVKKCLCPLKGHRIRVYDVWRDMAFSIETPSESRFGNGKSLGSIEGKQLCVISKVADGLTEVWVMHNVVDESMFKQRWEKRYSFRQVGTNSFANVIVDDVLLVLCGNIWSKLHLRDKKISYLTLDDSVIYGDTILFFQSDYLPCSFSRPPI